MNSAPLSAGKKWNQDKKKEEVRYLVKYTGIGYTQQPCTHTSHTHTPKHAHTPTLQPYKCTEPAEHTVLGCAQPKKFK